MAIYSRKEFATKCGMATNELSVYISRRKVVVVDDTIDTANQLNFTFFTKKQQNNEATENITRQQEINKTQTQETGKPKTRNKPRSESDQDYFFQLEQEQKEIQIEKAKQEVELLKIKTEKAQGVVIPTDLVKIIFSQHTKYMLVEFNNAADKMTLDISKKYGLSNAQTAELRKQLTSELNKAADKSIDESKKNIKGIVEEYTERRSIGEKK